jgi:hypothetical protein
MNTIVKNTRAPISHRIPSVSVQPVAISSAPGSGPPPPCLGSWSRSLEARVEDIRFRVAPPGVVSAA